MTKETKSFVDIVRQFGSDLGLPKVDVDKLVETHRKNFEALTQTALVASDGLKSVATKQKEMVESAFREALDMARSFKPTGDPQQIFAKQAKWRARRSMRRSTIRSRLPTRSVSRRPRRSKSPATGSWRASQSFARVSRRPEGRTSRSPELWSTIHMRRDRMRGERRGDSPRRPAKRA